MPATHIKKNTSFALFSGALSALRENLQGIQTNYTTILHYGPVIESATNKELRIEKLTSIHKFSIILKNMVTASLLAC